MYEIEAQGIRTGIINPYSGKGENSIAAAKRREAQAQNPNIDLNNILNANGNYGDPDLSVRMSGTSTRKFESHHSDKMRNSRTFKSQRHKSQDS